MRFEVVASQAKCAPGQGNFEPCFQILGSFRRPTGETMDDFPNQISRYVWQTKYRFADHGVSERGIATLVERHTRYVMLVKIANKDTQTVVSALIKQAKTLPIELYKSLTWDRGKELADHRQFTLATNIDVYFCDPRSPWQRGSNENTNGLLRQYFPKGTDLSVYSQTHLNKVARQLNERPRETLEYETPAERFNACVASTG